MSLDGVLAVEKGPGVTSFQVVAHLRRILRVPKVGHGGTLDPMATGVLPILLGWATRLTQFLQAEDKEYVATIRLGVTTDTLDATGRTMSERPVPPLDRAILERALRRFTGEIDQVPPMYSALHMGGQRLYELARAGHEVSRAPRRVRIDALDLLEWAAPRLTVRVACGKGTYVRSLAADLGEHLGCGACLEALTRTRHGTFALEDAVPWWRVQQGDPDFLGAQLQAPDRAVTHLPALELDAPTVQMLARGGSPGTAESIEGVCRLYVGGAFAGIGQVRAGRLHGLRLLHAQLPGPTAVPG